MTHWNLFNKMERNGVKRVELLSLFLLGERITKTFILHLFKYTLGILSWTVYHSYLSTKDSGNDSRSSYSSRVMNLE